MSAPVSAFDLPAFRVAVLVLLGIGAVVGVLQSSPHVGAGNPQYDAIVRAHAHGRVR